MSFRHPNDILSVRQARRGLSLIRQRLLKPSVEALDSCLPHLHNVVESIDGLQHCLRARGLRARGLRAREPQSQVTYGTLPAEVAELRRDLSQVTALMRNASWFYGGLSRLLSPREDDSTSYAPSGAVSTRAMPTLQFEG